uniref:Uncharacterized protein n=1 Tax=Candidatus Kentrum sp. MB TaxID=2138164 RepID=A0A450X0I8_9GAMM|nr:MAG: hypothetical protein BECKMB1821G_GA0114241_100312 [Candidatus Kentron sp. MB]VFK26456.1 MAG: hypothetical protein BECKMB1821I_GA0114274_10013 [Candidatus Kentron sp. MB]VFK74580.1 MAG: hypothetical protein BECKMB1821H_GA0114242_100671 [Candidatus Kentron sp. MB]
MTIANDSMTDANGAMSITKRPMTIAKPSSSSETDSYLDTIDS